MKNNFTTSDGILTIDIGNGLYTKVSLSKLDFLMQLNVKWHAHFDYNRYYVYGSVGGTTVKLHRILTDAPPGMVVDHINGDSLDNTDENLRICTQQENIQNRTQLNRNNTSNVRGVSFHKASSKWRAFVRHNRKQIHLGLFVDKAEAERVVNDYRDRIYKEETK